MSDEYGYVLMSGDADEYDTYPLGVLDDAAGAAWVEQYGDGGVVQRLPRVDPPRTERYEVLTLRRSWSILGEDSGAIEHVETVLRHPDGITPELADHVAPLPPEQTSGLWPYESEYTLRMYARAAGTDHDAVRAAFVEVCARVEHDGVAPTITALWVRRGIPAWAWSPPARYGPQEQGRILRECGATP